MMVSKAYKKHCLRYRIRNNSPVIKINLPNFPLFHLCLLTLTLLHSPLAYGQKGSAWAMVESPNFEVYYHPHVTSPQEIVDIAEDFWGTLDRLINGIPIGKIEIWVCETQKQFQAAVHAPIQDWAIGCAFPLSRRIIIQNPTVILQREFRLAQVLRHEIVHIAFGQRTQKAIGKIPRWFVEGIAIYLSGEWLPARHESLIKHIFARSVIPLTELAGNFPKSELQAQLAYAESLDAVAWLVEIAGKEKLWEIIDRLGDGDDLDTACKAAIGWDIVTFDAQWRESLPKRYHWVRLFASSHLFWGSLALLFFLAYLRYRYHLRRQLAQLEQEESEVDDFFKER